jgi:Protein of unknown function (DUF3185)
MNKPLSLGLLVGGVILIIYGVAASNSVGSGLSRLFNGVPTERTTWFLIGGAVALVGGCAGLMRGKRS